MNEGPFASLLRPELAALAAYVPHAGHFEVRLDANEAPDLLSERAKTRIAEELAKTVWSRYPDARHGALREALAETCGAEPEEILAGVGSDEVIALLVTALDRARGSGPPTIVSTTPTFVMYRMSALCRGLRTIEVPLDAAWDLDVAGMKKALDFGQPSLVFIATPNNPTGNLMSEDRLVAVIEAAKDAVVVVDEAYIDYAPRSQIALRKRFPNVVILRTLSKIGFAAARLGWMVGPRELVAQIDKARLPYNLSVPTQVVGTLVLRELREEIRHTVDVVVRERARLADALRALGFDVPESHANFLWLGTQRPAGELFDALAARSVLVRSFHARGGRLATRLRVTVGHPAENDRFLEAIAACR
jgi:histidinol-phosphate aminotransferase